MESAATEQRSRQLYYSVAAALTVSDHEERNDLLDCRKNEQEAPDLDDLKGPSVILSQNPQASHHQHAGKQKGENPQLVYLNHPLSSLTLITTLRSFSLLPHHRFGDIRSPLLCIVPRTRRSLGNNCRRSNLPTHILQREQEELSLPPP